MLAGYLIIFVTIAVVIFILYLLFDFASTNANQFYDKWVKKTLWIWLPFYALQRLIKEVILKKK
jgi:hypothetical protein